MVIQSIPLGYLSDMFFVKVQLSLMKPSYDVIVSPKIYIYKRIFLFLTDLLDFQIWKSVVFF